MEIKRRKTRQIHVGNVPVGGDAPVAVQSMIMSRTEDVKAAVAEIHRLEDAGCEIVRAAVPDETAAKALKEIKRQIKIPLVADIHFNHKLALIALDSGIDCLRINPGNIGGEDKVKAVVREAIPRKVPIRIGVNSGSVENDLLEKYHGPTPVAMVESALRHVRILEDQNFFDIKISIKSSNVRDTVDAYRLLSNKVDYPLHLGVTEAGTILPGAIKSALGIGLLLSEGIGDTIRVSLTADTVQEIKAAYEILADLGLRRRLGVEVVSCPTCGRIQIDLISLVARVEKRLANIKAPLKVSVLGCIVNGPGEAREADIGIAGGNGKGVIIRKGEIIRTCKEEELEDELMKEIEKIV
ncbi:MAG: flavodoxin-dependent (E)-4-hydroxy-3-methylbut-2-enyl-diphosphate synthase [Deltaproteobacteria bacterium]|nr:flavodoxin-dependent (E)-4-hydroxy-3-methylbut-2-enyl-diphosphate synthase [Deltaproteobacteria bacterium]MBI2974360.1 flavodoxin-dependent (E)-4-hydroxy-3-methylbut-2-enyl-diphosphate synthase [Deltaproteobacteria bacterium]